MDDTSKADEMDGVRRKITSRKNSEGRAPGAELEKALRILMLEDVPADAELVERGLKKGGIPFLSKRVETKDDFLKALKEFSPDLIFGDDNLPSFDGISALALAKERCPEAPFIFISGSVGEELAIETLKRGATDYILKDRLKRLVPAVCRALREVEDRRERRKVEEALRTSEESARRLARENAVIAEVGRIISSTLNIEEVYDRFAQEVGKLLPFDRIVINLINYKDRTIDIAYVAGMRIANRWSGDVIPLAGTANEEVIRTRSSMLLQPEEDENEIVARFPSLLPVFQAGIRSIMIIPLMIKDEVIGALRLDSRKRKAYTEEDLGVVERVGHQIGGAVSNALLFNKHLRAEQEMAVLQEQLRQSQKMEAIGRLAGGIAHDFNNLLTIIKGYSQISRLELKEGDPLRGNIEEIDKAANRAAALTRQLLAFSRRQVMEMKVLDLNTALRDLDKMLRRVIGEDIELVTLLSEDLGRVKTDPGQTEQVIMNLAVNARDAMALGGKLTIETANVDLDEAYAQSHVAVTPGRYVMIAVSDTGAGMTPEVKERIFEPFFTTKEKGKGTGSGLSTVYGIVKQSGGNVWVYSEPGRGTTFKIYLPRVDEPLAEPRERPSGEELPRGTETILLVEDEGEVLKLAVRILTRQGYKVLEAPHGGDALVICERYKASIQLMVTDVVMPGINGRKLAKRLQLLHPEMKVLYMSGYTDKAIVHHGVLEKGMHYIQKPFTVDGLARKVREMLDK